jgi:hypothetical protein
MKILHKKKKDKKHTMRVLHRKIKDQKEKMGALLKPNVQICKK